MIIEWRVLFLRGKQTHFQVQISNTEKIKAIDYLCIVHEFDDT